MRHVSNVSSLNISKTNAICSKGATRILFVRRNYNKLRTKLNNDVANGEGSYDFSSIKGLCVMFEGQTNVATWNKMQYVDTFERRNFQWLVCGSKIILQRACFSRKNPRGKLNATQTSPHGTQACSYACGIFCQILPNDWSYLFVKRRHKCFRIIVVKRNTFHVPKNLLRSRSVLNEHTRGKLSFASVSKLYKHSNFKLQKDLGSGKSELHENRPLSNHCFILYGACLHTSWAVIQDYY